VYVFWARPVPISELRPLMQALASRYRSLDATPMLNPSAGCIRPPGARHRTGAHQVLTTPLPATQAALATPCGPQVWTALLDVLAPVPATGPSAEKTTPGLLGPRRPVSERNERIARTGIYDTDRYATPSEARQAVITAAAAAGWTLPDLAARLEQGTWTGLAELYARYRSGVRTALTRDWRKALDFLSREKNGPRSTTRVPPHSAPSPSDLSPPQLPAGPDLAELVTGDVYGWIRCWQTGMLALERRGIGRWTPAKRLLWRSLGAFAQRLGSTTLEVGRRALAIDTGLDDSTVSELLRELRDADDPWIVLIANERGLDLADLYQLRIPDAVADTAAWRTWRAGRIEALHPVFRVLGSPAALAYEALSAEPAQRRDLARDAALPDRTLNRALTTLAEHGLAERLPHAGWRRGPADPDTLAEALGATELVQAQINAYAVERAAFRAAHGLPTASPAPTAYAGPDAATWWLDQLDAPDPTGPDEHDYDQALADTSAGLVERERHQVALELLRTELAAVKVSDTLDWTDSRYGVHGSDATWPASAPARAP
jgi:DNA-binding MarR family transcriptional regulator